MVTYKLLHRSINTANKKLLYNTYLHYKSSGYSAFSSYGNAVYIANGGWYL